MALMASASITTGLGSESSAGSVCRSKAEGEVSLGEWPAPGPTTSAVAAIVSSTVRSISSGWAGSKAGASGESRPT